MKILWVTAAPIGPASRILDCPYKGTSGGWVQNIYEEIEHNADNQMSFLCFDKKIKLGSEKYARTQEGEAYCFHMPQVSFGRKAPKKLKRQVEDVILKIKPDIIQIWGTETCVQNMIAQCAPDISKVVFIQGIIGIHERYRGGGLDKLNLHCSMNLKEKIIDCIKRKNFSIQAQLEQQEINACKNVIIDNVFTLSYCEKLKEKINTYYYHLVANKVFYDKEWSIHNCSEYSVFTVFSGGPDKGLHQLLRAIEIVKRRIPKVKVFIPGIYHLEKDKLSSNVKKLTPYERLLTNLIKELDIEDNVVFCGKLSMYQMAERLASSHIFVNPSCMEIHASSLREAMAVGVPSISTYCGSVGEYVIEGVNGFLYRYEEHEVLAHKMYNLLTNANLASEISRNAKEQMGKYREHSQNESILKIYEQIIERKKI